MTKRTQSSELERFGLYLRYGIIVRGNTDERKFNPYHDPDDGRFTFAPGGGTLPPRSHSPRSAGMTARVQREMAAAEPPKAGTVLRPRRPAPQQALPAQRRHPSALSAKYESGGHGDPGAISSVPNDPGGASYGKYQLSSKTKTVDDFVASPEARQWAEEFRDLRPASAQFDAKWKEIAAREPTAFGAAQEAFTSRTHYERAVRNVLRTTGVNLDGASEAVRQATYSTGVQHWRAPEILTRSIRQADRQSKRSDPAYQRILVNAIYDQRTAYVTFQRDSARKAGNLGEARVFDNVLRRYPNERADALLLLGVK